MKHLERIALDDVVRLPRSPVVAGRRLDLGQADVLEGDMGQEARAGRPHRSGVANRRVPDHLFTEQFLERVDKVAVGDDTAGTDADGPSLDSEPGLDVDAHRASRSRSTIRSHQRAHEDLAAVLLEDAAPARRRTPASRRPGSSCRGNRRGAASSRRRTRCVTAASPSARSRPSAAASASRSLKCGRAPRAASAGAACRSARASAAAEVVEQARSR